MASFGLSRWCRLPLVDAAIVDTWDSLLVEKLTQGVYLVFLGEPEGVLPFRLSGFQVRDSFAIFVPGPLALFAFLLRKSSSKVSPLDHVTVTGVGSLNIDACRIPGVPQVPWGKVRSYRAFHDKSYDSEADQEAAPANPLGRWPPNVVFVHSPECQLVGERQVKSSTLLTSHVLNETENRCMKWKNQLRSPRRDYAPSGLETIPAYDCSSECPIRLLDEQSDILRSDLDRNPTHKAVTSSFGSKMPFYSAQANYGDTGSASRFFPQFSSLGGVVSWMGQLITPPGGKLFVKILLNHVLDELTQEAQNFGLGY